MQEKNLVYPNMSVNPICKSCKYFYSSKNISELCLVIGSGYEIFHIDEGKDCGGEYYKKKNNKK